MPCRLAICDGVIDLASRGKIHLAMLAQGKVISATRSAGLLLKLIVSDWSVTRLACCESLADGGVGYDP